MHFLYEFLNFSFHASNVGDSNLALTIFGLFFGFWDEQIMNAIY